jgi:hypothetical protein
LARPYQKPGIECLNTIFTGMSDNVPKSSIALKASNGWKVWNRSDDLEFTDITTVMNQAFHPKAQCREQIIRIIS